MWPTTWLLLFLPKSRSKELDHLQTSLHYYRSLFGQIDVNHHVFCLFYKLYPYSIILVLKLIQKLGKM